MIGEIFLPYSEMTVSPSLVGENIVDSEAEKMVEKSESSTASAACKGVVQRVADDVISVGKRCVVKVAAHNGGVWRTLYDAGNSVGLFAPDATGDSQFFQCVCNDSPVSCTVVQHFAVAHRQSVRFQVAVYKPYGVASYFQVGHHGRVE